MREILFRGKNRKTGKWVYGAYSSYDVRYNFEKDPDEDGAYTRIEKATIIDYNNECLWVRVDPETVGQWTGLTDKNGVKVFEGDIVKTKYGRLCVVIWFSSPCHNGWTLNPVPTRENLQCTEPPSAYDLYVGDYLEVIGNIHDNQELLEVK